MRSSQYLVRLERSTCYRLERLRRSVDAAVGAPSAADKTVAHAAIEVINVWANFTRAYLLSCPNRPALRTNGVITLSDASVTTPGDVIAVATRTMKGPLASIPVDRRDEPDWKDPALFIKTSQAIGVSNFDRVKAAFGLRVGVFQHLPTFRNFYAHRNEDTAARALGVARRHYLISGAKRPTEALLARAHGRSQALLLDWIDETRVVVELLCD